MRLLVAALAWAATSGSAQADPLSIGVAILVNIGYTGAISGLGATIVGALALGVGVIGLSLASSALIPNQTRQQSPEPTPTDRQATIRQSIGPRLRFYGRVKVAGTLWWFETHDGYLYTGVTINWGKISAVQEYWLNDTQVTLDANGYVLEFPFNPVIRIFVKDGDNDQAAQTRLLEQFPGVLTADHRLRGMAYFVGEMREVARENIPGVYPQGNPNIRVVIDATLVKDVRTDIVAWSDNPSNIVFDYLTALDAAGFAYGAGYPESAIDVPSFQAFADLCDVPFPIRAGGTIPQYRLWGGYAMNEEQRDVLPRLLRSCDGDLYLTTEGKIAIRGGQWTEPELTLDSALGHILSAEFRQGASALAAFNELNVTYTEPSLDYQEAEAEPWVDAANVALRGQVLAEQVPLLNVPHHAQARHLAKIITAKENPRWIGTIITNFYGLNAINERIIRVKFGPLDIDETFRVKNWVFLEGMTGLQIEVSSLAESAYDWDYELEEGIGPADPPDTSEPVDLPPPADFAVTAEERIVGGLVSGVYLLATWTEPDREALQQEVQYRESPSGAWLNMSVADGIGQAESGLVNEGATYDARIRTLSPGGTFGDWEEILGIVATP